MRKYFYYCFSKAYIPDPCSLFKFYKRYGTVVKGFDVVGLRIVVNTLGIKDFQQGSFTKLF
jgi:hypothetical protein